jgi:hemoglobin-like flavoprotein
MYARFFQGPSITLVFDHAAQESGEQPRRLAGAILGYAPNIDKLQNLTALVQRVMTHHVETLARRCFPDALISRPTHQP